MINGSFEQCLDRVKLATRNLTAEQIIKVAKHHHQTGDNVWHSVHIVLKTPVCHCSKCEPK